MKRLAVLAAALTMAGCASGGEQAPDRPSARPAQRPPVVVRPLFPADYVATAASIDLLVIRSAELAAARGGQRVRAYAQTLQADHRGTSAQLSFGGRRLNLVPPAVLRPEHQAILGELTAAPNFDALYVRRMVSLHEQAVSVNAAFAQRGESPTLRGVARNALPIEREHLQQLRAMQ